VTPEVLTNLLAQQLLGWTVTPDRFLTGRRSWMPRWRFQPTQKLEDAFRLLDQAGLDEYRISGDGRGYFAVRVRIGSRIGEACGVSKPLAITRAIALALGIEVGSCD
jgi:hypothetical protein